MTDIALGLMSGTSADGVTAALVRFRARSVEVLRYRTYPYPAELRKRVLAAARLAAPELSRLNMGLGEAFSRAALSLMKGGPRPAVIGSHGQTVWHGPEASPPNTLQLGEPAVIAERTGIPVVADFRPRDIASGGCGAPLVPAFDEFLFSSGPLRAVVNIGGIANVSIVGRGKLWGAFDSGPGNGLMDQAVRLATGGRAHMDAGGRLAAKGSADAGKVKRLLAHPYFKRQPPKSLDKDCFGTAFLRAHFRLDRLNDTLATLALLTARSIALSLRKPVEEVVVSGGGALNPTLMRRLAEAVGPAKLSCSDVYGLPVMSKEAACFAWLARRALDKKTNNCPQATGAQGRRILGKIIPA